MFASRRKSGFISGGSDITYISLLIKTAIIGKLPPKAIELINPRQHQR